MTVRSRERKQYTRCSSCILPSQLQNSNFKVEGECAYCQSGFPNYTPVGEEKLQIILNNNRSKAGSVDCVVGVSGGKDSSYVLLRMKKEFGMNVEAFTYVHDGSTDFALENARKICNSAGVKHHLLSLPDHAHLKSFKAFFETWLESEDPVAAAMTCVACKHLHILGTRLARDRGAPMVIWSMCPLEVPHFIPTQPEGGTDSTSKNMSVLGLLLMRKIGANKKFRTAFFRDVFTNTFGCLAFRPDSGYLQLRYPSIKQLQFFDYCEWNSDRINETLRTCASWSIPESVVIDWHSDCSFNVFKEYMYQKMLGVSYTDAFLSNQIRHGLMTREQGWQELLISKEFYAREIIRQLPLLGLEHLRSKIDLSCFEVT